jgi:hypothetical protein
MKPAAPVTSQFRDWPASNGDKAENVMDFAI